MSTKKTMRKTTNANMAADTGNNGQPGYLGKLKLLHRDHELPIRVLNACQIRRKNAEPATVAKYRDLLSESGPPNIIVIQDSHGRHYIADGHNRTAAALAVGRTVIKANVYAGTHADARLVGLESNQHGLGLTLAEKKAALDEILDNNGHEFTDSALARMTGLDRHTVEKRRRERESGDFNLAVAVRKAVQEDELFVTFSTRRLLAFAKKIEPLGLAKALDATILSKLPRQERAVVAELAQRYLPGLEGATR